MKKILKSMEAMRAKMKQERGATMVEYALMLALIAVVCVGVVTKIGKGAEGTFTTIEAKMPAPAAPAP